MWVAGSCIQIGMEKNRPYTKIGYTQSTVNIKMTGLKRNYNLLHKCESISHSIIINNLSGILTALSDQY